MSQFYITKAFVCPYNRMEYQTDKKGDKIPNELLIREWIEFRNLSDRIVDLTNIQLYNQNYREDGTKIGEQRLTEFRGQIFAWDLVRVHSGKGNTYRSGKIHHTFLNRNYFTWNIQFGDCIVIRSIHGSIVDKALFSQNPLESQLLYRFSGSDRLKSIEQ